MRKPLQLSVARRFALIVALCGLAILVPAVKHAWHIWGETRALLREREGLPPIRALLSVVQLAQQHRGLSAVWLGGKEAAAAARAAKAVEVDRAIARFEKLLSAEGGVEPGSTPARHWAATREAWATLQGQVTGKTVDGPVSSARHAELIAGMLRNVDHLLDHWGLIFDPVPGDYFLVVGTLQEAPRTIEVMGQMRARGANLLSAPDKATPAQRAGYAMLAENLRAQFDRATFNLQRAADTGAGDAAALKKIVGELSEQGSRGIAMARKQLVEPETLSHDSAAFVADMTVVIDAMYAGLDGLLTRLDMALELRAREAVTSLALVAVLVLSLFAAAIGVAVQTGARLRRSLGAEPDELREAAQVVARGDLASALPVRADDTTSVVAAMREMQQSLARLVDGVRDNAGQVAAASGQIAQGNQDLSTRTESQASALQQTAASMEELRTTLGQSSDSARQANRLAGEASEVARRGGERVGGLAATMSRIQESSRRIAEIIGTIDGISFQTNILALNAAVEAARAGEQGRGFAVVASEVRALAQRSAEAAREIRTLIADSVERVEQGSRQGTEAAATMQEVVAAIGRVSKLIGEVSAAAQEQSSGVAQASDAVSQMDAATQRNAALVEQSAAAAESLRQQAAALTQAVASFRTTGATA
ncbi:MAG: methyl-accepting chemotaxis protein [Burkholderiales bacterium]|nr:methyl-accepting chemotaxis protein [Burkholderiales bacterium]